MIEQIVIQVVVGDRKFRLKINRKDEEVVRKTIKFVNDKLLEFKTAFAGKDMQDYISMVLLWFATEQNNVGDFIIAQEAANQKLTSLEHRLDKLLEE